jgi:hypothetical protein
MTLDFAREYSDELREEDELPLFFLPLRRLKNAIANTPRSNQVHRLSRTSHGRWAPPKPKKSSSGGAPLYEYMDG